MDILGQLADKVGRQLIVDQSFKAGLNGEPRPQRIYPAVQEISDKAYEHVQRAAITKSGGCG
jgi:hypothetical protein